MSAHFNAYDGGGGLVWARHGKAANVCYGDGHVEAAIGKGGDTMATSKSLMDAGGALAGIQVDGTHWIAGMRVN